MTNILLIGRHQFGYLVAYYNYCCNCPDDVHITYIGIKSNADIISCPNKNVTVRDITRPAGNSIADRIYSKLSFYLIVFFYLIFSKYDLVYFNYFPACRFFRFFTLRPAVIDIRTGDISKNDKRREKRNRRIRNIASKFTCITTLCTSMAEKLRLPEQKTKIIPLGTNFQSIEKPLDYKSLSLLYVGSLRSGLEKTVQGLHLFLKKNPNIAAHYDIIGKSFIPSEVTVLNDTIAECNLRQQVVLHGYIHNSRLAPFLEKDNLGVSFIPMGDIYDCQPPTKTFEYMGAGLPVIATATSENCKIICEHNGVLVSDSAESFAEGLEQFWKRRSSFDKKKVRDSIQDYSWAGISQSWFQLLKDVAKSFN